MEQLGHEPVNLENADDEDRDDHCQREKPDFSGDISRGFHGRFPVLSRR
jgi:hypothetical protein